MSKKRNVIAGLIVGTILYQLCHAIWLKKTRNDATQNAIEQRRTYHILPKNSGNRASILPPSQLTRADHRASKAACSCLFSLPQQTPIASAPSINAIDILA